MKTTILTHVENGTRDFTDETSFVEFVKRLFDENEESSDVVIESIDSYWDSVNYIHKYCDSFEVNVFFYQARKTEKG